jgi:hypothetical protein
MKKSHPLVSAIFSIVFPVGTFIIILYILCFGNTPRLDDVVSALFAPPLIFGGVLLLPLFGAGIAFGFILGVQALYSIKELASHKTLILLLATAGILCALVELVFFVLLST